jgi:hypothetical protein
MPNNLRAAFLPVTKYNRCWLVFSNFRHLSAKRDGILLAGRGSKALSTRSGPRLGIETMIAEYAPEVFTDVSHSANYLFVL